MFGEPTSYRAKDGTTTELSDAEWAPDDETMPMTEEGPERRLRCTVRIAIADLASVQFGALLTRTRNGTDEDFVILNVRKVEDAEWEITAVQKDAIERSHPEMRRYTRLTDFR